VVEELFREEAEVLAVDLFVRREEERAEGRLALIPTFYTNNKHHSHEESLADALTKESERRTLFFLPSTSKTLTFPSL
jgi:hypothetical protein